MGPPTAKQLRLDPEEEGQKVEAPKISPESLKLIEELEAELATLTGDARRPLRVKLRKLRRGAGVPMSRVRGTTGRRSSRGPVTSRIEGEDFNDAKTRLKSEIEDEVPKIVGEKPFSDDGYAMPVCYPGSVLVKKFVARHGRDPAAYSFIAGPPALVVFW